MDVLILLVYIFSVIFDKLFSLFTQQMLRTPYSAFCFLKSEVGLSFSHAQVPPLVVMCCLFISLVLKYKAETTAWSWPFSIPPSFPLISLCPRVSERCVWHCSGVAVSLASCRLSASLPAVPQRPSFALTHCLVRLVCVGIVFSCAYWLPPFLKLHSWLVGITFFKSISYHYLHSLPSM